MISEDFLAPIIVALPITVASVILGLWIKGFSKKFTSFEIKIDEIKKDVDAIALMRAEERGKREGERDLVWREINTDKNKIQKLQSQMEKAWSVLEKVIAHIRPSDKLK